MTNPNLCDILSTAEQLHTTGQIKQAAELYRQALNLNPELSRTSYNLGLILLEQQNYVAAASAFQSCLAIEPDLLEARLNLAFAQQEQGHTIVAADQYRSILIDHPSCTTARFNLACLQLLQGNLTEGFQGYELRFSTNDPVTARHGAIPLWDGTRKPGLRILIHAEQGYGDTIHMLRYLPLLADDGLQIVLEVPAPLYHLCCRINAIHCIPRGTPLPDVDYQLPIMSLPRVCNTTLATIPAKVPYLAPEDRLVYLWKQKLAATRKLRIGLAWAGRMDLPVNRKRSCPPDLIRLLLEHDHIDFISLQQQPAEGFELHDSRLQDITAQLTDFHQTAALITSLDLVITIDTAVAHLAGALGVPTWLLLPNVPDWRWLLERQDSPWYPTMRLFRQPDPGDWSTVIHSVVRELESCCTPRIWSYQDGVHFNNKLTETRPTPLSDSGRWPQLGIRKAASPQEADWLLFPYYLEYLTEYQTVDGMWRLLEQLPWFSERHEHHLLFSDHDCTAPYHSAAAWFRASIDPQRRDPAAEMIPYQVEVPAEHLHFDPNRIRCHISFIGYLGLLRERAALINGIIAEPRLVHQLDLTTRFHLHQSAQNQEERWQRYLATSSSSCCVLCPRGDGSSSKRLYETLALGRIAVVHEPILLPFSDRIDYDRFVIRIPHDQTDQAGAIVYDWLATRDAALLDRCREARAAWEQHLAPAVVADGILRAIRRRQLLRTIPSPLLQKDRQKRDITHSPDVLLSLARAAEARGELVEAESCLLDTLQYDHRCYDAYMALAHLLIRSNRFTEAVGRLYQASLLRPSEPTPYELALPLLEQLQRIDEAAWCRQQLERPAAVETIA